MATVSGPNVAANVGNVSLCKKCGIEHERPVGAKCESNKPTTKDEKKDPVIDVKKTPKNKSVNETSSQECWMLCWQRCLLLRINSRQWNLV